MIRLLIVGAGGFLGAVSRYWLSGLVQRWTQDVDIPYGTLAVNVLGCLGFGMLIRVDEMTSVLSPETRLLVLVGFLGAFTTYSTFANETVVMFNDRRLILAAANMVAHLVMGMLAVWAGRSAVYLIWR